MSMDVLQLLVEFFHLDKALVCAEVSLSASAVYISVNLDVI